MVESEIEEGPPTTEKEDKEGGERGRGFGEKGEGSF